MTPGLVIGLPRGACASFNNVVKVVAQLLQVVGSILEGRADEVLDQVPRLDLALTVVIGVNPRREAGGDRLSRAQGGRQRLQGAAVGRLAGAQLVEGRDEQLGDLRTERDRNRGT